MKFPIYLDYAATTPVDTRVAEKMMHYLTMDGVFANPASKSHSLGWKAAEAVDIARNQVADLIGADSREIVFTSGATECDNLAVVGLAAHAKALGRKRIITSMIEHKAILDSCRFAADVYGCDITYLKPNSDGIVTPEMLEESIDDQTLLVTLMHANNEIGVIQDIKELAEVAHKHGALFHSDCAQSAGKVLIDVKKMPVDFLSLCAHKIYGPKGIGAFYIREGVTRPEAVIHGGGHERGLRSGTLATHQIVGIGEAFDIARKEMAKDNERLGGFRDKLYRELTALEGVHVNGSMTSRLPTNINLTFTGVDGENFLMNLRQLAVSTGSACTSASMLPSYVLKALGLSDADAHSSLRITLGRFVTEEEIDFTIDLIKKEYLKEKNQGNLWKM